MVADGMQKKWVLLGMLCMVIVLSVCAYTKKNHRQTATVSNEKIEEPKKVALTFDDGPSPETTEDLLEGLAERNVKATFFVIGEKAEAYPDLIAKIYEGGHLIGNHSYSHVNLELLSEEEACEQINHTNQVICSITGETPEYLRSPFGSTKANLECDMGMIEVLWDVDPRDWEVQNAPQIIQHVVKNTKEGDIILLHDGYDTSMVAAFAIIDQLQAQGYQFVTVDEMIFE